MNRFFMQQQILTSHDSAAKTGNYDRQDASIDNFYSNIDDLCRELVKIEAQSTNMLTDNQIDNIDYQVSSFLEAYDTGKRIAILKKIIRYVGDYPQTTAVIYTMLQKYQSTMKGEH